MPERPNRKSGEAVSFGTKPPKSGSPKGTNEDIDTGRTRCNATTKIEHLSEKRATAGGGRENVISFEKLC